MGHRVLRATMFGLASDVPLTRDTMLAAIHPDDRDMAVAAIRQVRYAGEPIVTHVRRLRKARCAGSAFERVHVS